MDADGRVADFLFSCFFNNRSINGKYVIEGWIACERKRKDRGLE
jgi:hypothetical protein